MTSIQPKTRLVGAELKSKVDEMMKQGMGFSACARATGYTNVAKNGTEIPAASLFSRALLDAVGYQFASSGGAGGGRARDGKVKVMGAGNLIIAKGYARDANLSPGDTLKIDVADDGTITLTKQDEKPVLETLREPVSDEWTQQSF